MQSNGYFVDVILLDHLHITAVSCQILCNCHQNSLLLYYDIAMLQDVHDGLWDTP
jgi:hypothetical protein